MTKILKYIIPIFLPIFGYGQKASDIFGAFSKPELLSNLEEYQNENRANWEDLGFYIKYKYVYSVTPIDVIPFAYTGYAGLHFGFLTDFGQVETLNEAPIVAISPTSDPPIRLVSKNLVEFLSLVCYSKDATLLVHPYAGEEEFLLAQKERFNGDTGKDFLERVEKTEAILHEDFNIPKIEKNSFVSTILQSMSWRKSVIDYPTKDMLGIFFGGNEAIIEFSYERDIKNLKAFLDTVNRNSRIVFYRNSTLMYILSKGYDESIKEETVKYLFNDGFIREAQVLKKYY
ncbi:MAG: hypothetical protein AAF600_02715 [Bacteroidota bacterium]